MKNKTWYKTWWGVLIAILFLPLFLIYIIWKKKSWKPSVKWALTVVILLFCILVLSSSNQNSPTQAKSTKKVNTQSQEQIKTEDQTVTINLPYSTQTKDDSSLAEGTTQTQQQGNSGKKVDTYKVTIQNGKRISKKLISSIVTIQPKPKVILNGIYVAPTTSTTVPSGDGYTNVDGNYVQSPTASNTIPSGATAQCNDGTYSFSQNHSGTCSHHGGVSVWY
jgi:hypothetical protein